MADSSEFSTRRISSEAPELSKRRVSSDIIPLETLHSSETVDSATSMPMDFYNIYYTTSRMNVTLHTGNSDSPAQYYVEWKLSKLVKPQIYFRKGATKMSPTIGAAKVTWTSKNMLIARGDYEHHPDQTLWQELHREKGTLRSSDWHLALDDVEAGSNGYQTKLLWRKDRSKKFATVYACEDEHGNVLAKLRSGGALNWKKGGELEVSSEGCEELKQWLLISALSLWLWEALDYGSLRSGFTKRDHHEGKDD